MVYNVLNQKFQDMFDWLFRGDWEAVPIACDFRLRLPGLQSFCLPD